ncbi:LysR family transcriptional regulator [Alsobacter soli]|nr:LysR family transcriptional regulator [Alsobacter soli]
MRIDYLGLEAFVSIGDRGSFNRAAAHLNLSQTALSHRLKKLEDDLGLKLLARTTRSVSLTPAGVELLPKARRLIEDLQASFEDLRRQGKARQERLEIACLPTLAVHYLSRVLKDFAAEHPQVSVRVHDNSAGTIAELVQSGQAEFGLSIVSANRWDLEIEPLFKEPFVLACPKDHPLARNDVVAWSDLEGAPLVRISAQTGNRALIDDALGPRREQMTWRYEVQHLASAVSLVAAGVALAIVPRLAVSAADTPGIATVTLRNPGVSRTLGIVSRRGQPLSPAAAALRALIERRMRQEAGEGGRTRKRPARIRAADASMDA